MAIPVALQSHCGASWEIQVLQPNRGCRERSSVEMGAAPAPAGVVRRGGGSGAHTVRPAGGPAHRRGAIGSVITAGNLPSCKLACFFTNAVGLLSR